MSTYILPCPIQDVGDTAVNKEMRYFIPATWSQSGDNQWDNVCKTCKVTDIVYYSIPLNYIR